MGVWKKMRDWLGSLCKGCLCGETERYIEETYTADMPVTNVSRYVNLLFVDMIRAGRQEIILREDQVLPQVSVPPSVEAPEEPTFEAVRGWLQEMGRLWEPASQIETIFDKDRVLVEFEFEDDGSQVIIRMSEE